MANNICDFGELLEQEQAKCDEESLSNLKTEASLSGMKPDKIASKKRIGPYSYYPSDFIGSGYSSTVYRGIKDNLKGKFYAIKVIGVRLLEPHHRRLLDNQIEIMKSTNHPNLLKLQDIYFTSNNCYLITEYCQGGNLQKMIDEKKDLEWGKALFDIGNGCRYLAEKSIVHRDIKPANVFRKGDVWKIGDLGFAKRLSGKNTIVKEDFIIGSPLYMPLQSLEKNHYSSKTDSFAFGIIIYYVLSRNFPWSCREQQELIHKYRTVTYQDDRLKHVPLKIREMVRKLLDMRVSQRIHLTDCELQPFLHLRLSKNIKNQLQSFDKKYAQQLTICQFIHYLMKNAQYSLQNDQLFILMSKHLGSLVDQFGWHNQKHMQVLKRGYTLLQAQNNFEQQDYFLLQKALKEVIVVLLKNNTKENQVQTEKLLSYLRIVQYIMYQDCQKIVNNVKKLSLHADYTNLLPNRELIQSLLNQIDLYSL